jgi:hypothetical protein
VVRNDYLYLFKLKVMKKHYTSKLAEITEIIFSATDFLVARNILTNFIEGTQVKSKNKMLFDIKNLKTLHQVQRYTANALLKFEGLSATETKAA